MHESENSLQDLPKQNGFRLRGVEMTRLETFSDAAFAFAMTMLVISIDHIPGNYQELVAALKGVPAFAASFAQIMWLWVGHRTWSRRYGLEDATSTVLSLCLIFIMLVYVYPLRLIFSSLFAWLSGNWLPSEFVIHDTAELAGLFGVYGLGFGALAGALALLYLHAHSVAASLQLDDFERIKTTEEIVSLSVQASTGLASAAFAWVMPTSIATYAGFIYFSLSLTMPFIAIYYSKKTEPLSGTSPGLESS